MEACPYPFTCGSSNSTWTLLPSRSHDNIFDYWEDKQILRKKKRERGRYTNDKIFNHQNNGFNNPKVKEIERI